MGIFAQAGGRGRPDEWGLSYGHRREGEGAATASARHPARAPPVLPIRCPLDRPPHVPRPVSGGSPATRPSTVGVSRVGG